MAPLGVTSVPQHIEYAKSKSYATLQKEDPNFVHPSLSQTAPAANFANGVSAEKRTREDDDAENERERKREKSGNDAEEDEMEIEEEEGRDANGHTG